MDFWEQFILHAALGIVSAVIKNPHRKAALQQTLVSIADAIYQTYGYSQPQPGK